MKILGLDIGTKRIGVAVSDKTQLIASVLTTIHRQEKQQDINQIVNLIKENDAEEVVVGLPLNMDGTIGPSAQEVLDLVEELKGATDKKISTWDERLSTLATEKMLIEADISRKKRKEAIDMLSAQNILQGYLDWKKRK